MTADLGELDVMANNARTKRQGVPPSRVGARLNRPALAPAESPPDPSDAPAAAKAAPRASKTPAGPVRATEPVVEPLVKTTMHLGPAEDAFLENVRYAGRSARPKVDASRSAVARLAIARLAEQMEPAEIVAELQRRAAPSNAPGRKRN